MFQSDHFSQRGQALLIVVLVMVVALTVGLALASRSITNLRNANDDVSSQRAFSAAEAGVERALKSGVPIANQQLDSLTTILQVSIDNTYGTSTFLINDGNSLPKDDGADVWLSTYPTYGDPKFTGRAQIYWGSNANCSDAALEIIVIQGSKADPNMQKFAVDPCSTRGNSFDSPTGSGGTIANKTFRFSTAVGITDGLIMRVIPLYAGTPIAVVGFHNDGTAQLLPQQGKLITSVGSSGNTQRKISYFAGYDELPSELFYSIFQTP